MEKTTTGAIASVLALGAVDPNTDGQHSPAPPPAVKIEIAPPGQPVGQLGGSRNLRLDAFGTRQPGPGQVRIPIPTESATYEVIVAEPGLPRSVPVAK